MKKGCSFGLITLLIMMLCFAETVGLAEGILTLPANTTRIEAEAFANAQGFTEIILPSRLTYIGSKAFEGSSLLEMTIPQSVSQIEEDAFERISSEAVITVYRDSPAERYFVGKEIPFTVRVIESDVEPWSDVMGEIEYDENGGLIVRVTGVYSGISHLVFDDNLNGIPVTQLIIEPRAFAEDMQLESITFANVPTSIGSSAFYGCKNLKGSLILPEGLTQIGANAFYECSGLTGSLTIPSSVETIDYMAFAGCSGFDGELILLPGLKEIGSYAFMSASFTGSLIIPDTVQKIGGMAFAYTGFTGSLVIPGSVDEIEWQTFMASHFRETLSLGEGIKTIEYGAFSGLKFSGGLKIPDSIQTIEENAFNHAGFDGELILGSSVESIGVWAFRECGFTGSLIIPESVKDIGNSAFEFCRGFNGTLTLGHNVERIGSTAFAWCDQFTGSLIIPDSVTTMGAGAFQGCAGLRGTLTFPRNIEVWERYTTYNSVIAIFDGCTGIKKVIIPNGITEIPSGMFSGCTGLETVVIGSEVTSIESNAFADCINLRGVLDLSNVTSIGTGAFKNCSSLMGCRLSDNIDSNLSNIFSNMNEQFTIYCDVDSNTAKAADKAGIAWSHMSVNMVDGLPSGQLPMGEVVQIRGYLQCNMMISKLRATIFAEKTNEIVRLVELDVNELAVGFYRLTSLLTIEDLSLGRYGFTLEVLMDGAEGYWTISNTAFEIVYAPVKYWRSVDFVVPSGLIPSGKAYMAKGSVSVNRDIEAVDMNVTDIEGNLIRSERILPNKKTLDMSEAFADLHIEEIEAGLYQLDIYLTVEGVTRKIVSNQFRIYEYDGELDEKTAQAIVEFCLNDKNRTILSKYNDYADYLKDMNNWDTAAMVVSKYSDIVRDQIIAAMTGSKGNGFVIKLYKNAIVEMMQSFDPNFEQTEIETDFEKYATAFLKDLSKEGMISANAVLDVYEEYASYLEQKSDGIIDKFRLIAIKDEIDYIKNVKDGMKFLSNISKVEKYTVDAVKVFIKATTNYEAGMRALASLSGAYGDRPSQEFVTALREVMENYHSSACIVVTEAFEIIEEKMVESGIKIVQKHIFENMGASLTYSIATFVLDKSLEVFGVKDLAESDFAFLTMVNMMLESRLAFSQAFDAVQNGDTSAERLKQVYYTFEATQYSLGEIYDQLIEMENDDYIKEMEMIGIRNEISQLKIY